MEETREALVEFVARELLAQGEVIAWEHYPESVHDMYRTDARLFLDRLAAEDSPVLLVARGDVEERVEWGVRYRDWSIQPYKTREGAKEAAWHLREMCELAGSRTVRSWSLPDGTRVEVTGPWSEVGE